MAMGNPFVHIELTTTDINKSKSFYKSLFDWKLEDIDMQGGQTYTMIKVGEGTGGGMFQMAGAPAMWLPYVLVDDVKKTTEKAKSLGAKVVRDVTEIPNMGWFSILSDPSGAMIALWQASARS
jgi:predicted enzyme related to lactoylglutathione lyase